MLAREEMGKARILFKLSDDVDDGKVLSEQELTEALDDHREKQTHAQLSVVLSFVRGTQLDKLMRKSMDPSDPDFEAANAEIEEVQNRKRRRTPDERHNLRQRAMYVDPIETGGDWNRPVAFNKEECSGHLCHAMNDYSVLLLNLDFSERYRRIRERLSDWPDRPKLPERR